MLQKSRLEKLHRYFLINFLINLNSELYEPELIDTWTQPITSKLRRRMELDLHPTLVISDEISFMTSTLFHVSAKFRKHVWFERAPNLNWDEHTIMFIASSVSVSFFSAGFHSLTISNSASSGAWFYAREKWERETNGEQLHTAKKKCLYQLRKMCSERILWERISC